MNSATESNAPDSLVSGSALVVDNYDLFREGDFEPYLGKKIHILVYKEKECIVYIDEDLFVEWAFTPNYSEWDTDFSRVLNRVTDVQAYPLAHLSQEQLCTFRQLVAEAVARLLKDRKPRAANEALDTAVRWVQARNREIARWWYLKASGVTAMLAALALLVLWLFRMRIAAIVGETALEVALGAGAGSIGALLFILWRSKGIQLDPSAAKRIHQFEGVARVAAGGIGAALVALAIKGGVILQQYSDSANHLCALLAACMLAGASERFVPNLVEKVTGKEAARDVNESDGGTA